MIDPDEQAPTFAKQGHRLVAGNAPRTPKTMRAAMMSTWGTVHADGPCVIANPEVLDAMLTALQSVRGAHNRGHGLEFSGALGQVDKAIAKSQAS